MQMCLEEAINNSLPMLKKLSKHFSKNGIISYEDALQEAILGFINGFNHFDSSKGASLYTYSRQWVINQLQIACNRNIIVHVPNGVTKEILADYNKKTDKDKPKKERSHTSKDEVKNAAINALLQSYHPDSIHTDECDDKKVTNKQRNIEYEISENYRNIYLETENKIDCDKIKKFVDTLSVKQKKVFYCRFIDDMSLEDTGKTLNISRENVRQLQERSFIKIKKFLKCDA